MDIVRLDDMDLAVGPWDWPFARERRAEIDAHFAERQARTPELWNGRLLMARRWAIAGGVLSGDCFETDFASFLAWCDWDFPDRSVTNCFSMAAIYSSDHAFLLGVMGAHTAHAGQIYFPAGTPDPGDVIGGRLDLRASVLREVGEETGLTADDVEVEPGWHAALTGPRIALMKILRAREPAAALRDGILDRLARQRQPELADIRIVRGSADFDPAMPPFVTAFIEHML